MSSQIYVPITNFVGPTAGQSFRDAVNARFNGNQPVGVSLVNGYIEVADATTAEQPTALGQFMGGSQESPSVASATSIVHSYSLTIPCTGMLWLMYQGFAQNNAQSLLTSINGSTGLSVGTASGLSWVNNLSATIALGTLFGTVSAGTLTMSLTLAQATAGSMNFMSMYWFLPEE